ncbi:pyridoxal-phosphate dependent enzyme [Actinomadura parmotrematis]|uniref:Pyridoxal-phosphate dependent enzyme n=1 Tax=Actinomadura parmotrematis TaxID=2864039 RepID=A0ABS7FR34_9ACTN|nr:pyridoxal-phosphate dependent enzyme [Actinomadura parmotrematis]MBW8482868.1 pyridoxal-phosphate dependent enzyme [Actinomadura parmotrematis]
MPAATAPAPTAPFSRPAARAWTCAPPPAADVAAFHAALPGYAPTPLVEIPDLAAELGAARLFVKDESARLGLPAFKILGASWGLHRTWRGERTLLAATDGNHGRAVAALARQRGLAARVHVPEGVPDAARAAIAAEGAEVVAVNGSYEEAVRRAAAEAGPDALLVQDTAVPGHDDVPARIVEGYSTLFTEIDAQLAAAGAAPAGLVAVPAGVGSLVQAAVTHYRSGPARPSVLAVEPADAACVLAALRAGAPVTLPAARTAIAALNCAEVSALAWPVLAAGLDAAVAVTDADAARGARDLAAHGVTAGPCGGAALAGARATAPAAGTVVLLSTDGAP